MHVPARGTRSGMTDRRLEGWGGAPDDAPELTPEQAAGLQEREEPVAQGNFGGALKGDLGHAEEIGDLQPDATEPDTSLGHEGGERYREARGDA